MEIVAAHYVEASKILGSDRIIEAANFFVAQNPDTLTRRTVAEVVGELLAAKESRGASVRYIQDLRARLNRFAEAFVVDISSVTTADVQRWFDGLKLSAQSVRNFRTVLGTLFNFAEARGYILKGSNTIEATEKVSAKNSDAVEIFTPSEIAKLLAASAPEFRARLALGAFAGLRSAEIERIAWTDIDLKSGHIVGAQQRRGGCGRTGMFGLHPQRRSVVTVTGQVARRVADENVSGQSGAARSHSQERRENPAAGHPHGQRPGRPNGGGFSGS